MEKISPLLEKTKSKGIEMTKNEGVEMTKKADVDMPLSLSVKLAHYRQSNRMVAGQLNQVSNVVVIGQ